MNGTEGWQLGQSADHCLLSACTCHPASLFCSVNVILQGTVVLVFFSCIHKIVLEICLGINVLYPTTYLNPNHDMNFSCGLEIRYWFILFNCFYWNSLFSNTIFRLKSSHCASWKFLVETSSCSNVKMPFFFFHPLKFLWRVI